MKTSTRSRPATASIAAEPLRVLHVMSYHSPWRWTDDQYAAFQEALDLPGTEHRVFQMDTKRHNDPAWKEQKGEEAGELVRSFDPHLLYTTDDDAQAYVAQHFVDTDVKLVFSGVNRSPDTYGYDKASNVAGVLEQEHFVESLRLLRSLARLNAPAIELGDSTDLPAQTRVLVAGPDGPSPALVVSRREFAGYWEYLLPDAIFTSPPYPSFGGAALIGSDGRLLGIGSLIVADAAAPGQQLPGNMFVPISALKPIMADLLRVGRSAKTPRPWLGLNAQEMRGHVFISRVTPDGPADKAGVGANAIVMAVGGKPVSTLAEFYRAIWGLGDAGVAVPLTLLEANRGEREVTVTSGNRYDFLRLNPTY